MVSEQSVGKRIRAAREEREMTQQDVGKLLGISRAAVAQWETDVTSPSLHTIGEVAKILSSRPEWLAFGIGTEPKIVYKPKDGLTVLNEVAIGDKPSERVTIREWDIPTDYLRGELRCSQTSDLFLWSVDGSSMPAYEHGDKVIVDAGAKRPSPSGTFLIWDGVGPALAQVIVVPVDGKTVARVMLDGRTTSYEVAPEKLQVLGRVRGVLKNV